MQTKINLQFFFTFLLIVLSWNCSSKYASDKYHPSQISQYDSGNRINQERKLEGKLEYLGKKEYLPEFIIENSNSNSLMQYEYTIDYEPKEISDFWSFVPPLLLYFFFAPVEHHSVTATGKLNLGNGKFIQAEVRIWEIRNFIITPNYKKMRKDALIALKEQIEREFYEGIWEEEL